MNGMRTQRILTVLVLPLILSGCLPLDQRSGNHQPEAVQETMDSVPAAEPLRHTIRWKGETLIRISSWYTGSGLNWRAIAAANPSLDPKGLQLGEVVVIPPILIKTREPMPQDYRVRSPRKSDARSDRRTPPPMTGEDLELFGPLDTYGNGTNESGGEKPLPLETLEEL